ncbi:hypothetical protein GGR53DRAFT_510365 [Hypoxylon sp. FL1150]|nr:hypothetical protein GGR53DRAFT_510365 [Hypoxylon sp. FL1150]
MQVQYYLGPNICGLPMPTRAFFYFYFLSLLNARCMIFDRGCTWIYSFCMEMTQTMSHIVSCFLFLEAAAACFLLLPHMYVRDLDSFISMGWRWRLGCGLRVAGCGLRATELARYKAGLLYIPMFFGHEH